MTMMKFDSGGTLGDIGLIEVSGSYSYTVLFLTTEWFLVAVEFDLYAPSTISMVVKVVLHFAWQRP